MIEFSNRYMPLYAEISSKKQGNVKYTKAFFKTKQDGDFFIMGCKMHPCREKEVISYEKDLHLV